MGDVQKSQLPVLSWGDVLVFVIIIQVIVPLNRLGCHQLWVKCEITIHMISDDDFFLWFSVWLHPLSDLFLSAPGKVPTCTRGVRHPWPWSCWRGTQNRPWSSEVEGWGQSNGPVARWAISHNTTLFWRLFSSLRSRTQVEAMHNLWQLTKNISFLCLTPCLSLMLQPYLKSGSLPFSSCILLVSKPMYLISRILCIRFGFHDPDVGTFLIIIHHCCLHWMGFVLRCIFAIS